MPKSGKQIIEILKNRGWTIKSQTGSYVKLEYSGKLVIVPLHGNRTLGRGLIKAIEKQTGVKLI
ncbi:type II toxin-antitoxin system HicA family toxin [Candidatus Dojkabacteria bacterium]|uniref:Type II toxin-antitoxin system HicA family toxin n=1 Tax=Candidatus Dojkabacteria bacterium TaxID=2099670 RepID=A0A955KVN0_9BACT|nr:type II toxin-antitoxin system HicA family toxin [Candidatus Dojkabacteria bacterium]